MRGRLRITFLFRLSEAPSDFDLNASLASPSTASAEVVEKLKSEAASCFNDAFFARMEDVRRIYGGVKDKSAEVAFLEVVIRHLRRLANLHTR
jgi:hypothetical protein